MGVLASFIISLAVVPTFVGRGAHDGLLWIGPATIIAGIVVGTVIGIKAPSAAKAWRRILIILAMLCFSLPLAGVVCTGGMVSTISDKSGGSIAAGAGVALGGTLISGFLGFVGLFLGVILLVIGLLVGRDRQIVYIRPPPQQPPSSP